MALVYAPTPASVTDSQTGETFEYRQVASIEIKTPTLSTSVNPSFLPIFKTADYLQPEWRKRLRSMNFISAAHAAETGALANAKEAYGHYKDAKSVFDAVKKAKEEQERENRPISERDLDDLLNVKFFQEGLKKGLKVDFKDKVEWLREYVTRLERAAAYIDCRMQGKCDDGSADKPISVDPTKDVVVPGNTGMQRLGLSLRSAQ